MPDPQDQTQSPQQGSQPWSESSGTAGVPTSSGMPVDIWKAGLAAISDPTGLTKVQPNLGGAQLPQVHQRQQQPMQAQGGMPRNQAIANLGAAASNLAGGIAQRVEQHKQRQVGQVVGQYVGFVQGIQQAQAQAQQAQQILAKDPGNQQAQQMLQQAQQALKQNQTNLDDIANDPKKHKVITKAFGIDDKNANTPERQAAVQALQKSMGVGAQAAGMLSRTPQTLGLSPEGQQRQIAGQAGVYKPPTGGQVLNAEMQQQRNQNQMAIAALNNMTKAGVETEKVISQAGSRGLSPVRDPSGSLARNPDGSIQWRNMTPEERKDNPVMAAQDGLTEAKTEAQRAAADAKMNPNNPALRIAAINAQAHVMDANARMVAAQAAQLRASIAMSPPAAAATKMADQLETTYKNAKDFLAHPSPTNDTQLVFAYVRAAVQGAGRMTNTEIEQSLKSGSMGTRASNLYNRATTGKLDDEFRQQLVNSIGIAAQNARSTANKYQEGAAQAGDMSNQGDVITVTPEDMK